MKLFSTFFVLASIVVGGFAAANVTINASIQALISACDATTAIVTALTPSSDAAAIANLNQGFSDIVAATNNMVTVIGTSGVTPVVELTADATLFATAVAASTKVFVALAAKIAILSALGLRVKVYEFLVSFRAGLVACSSALITLAQNLNQAAIALTIKTVTDVFASLSLTVITQFQAGTH